MKIEQAKFSYSIDLFRNDFLNKWKISEYHDKNKACFFAGVYSQNDIDIINQHKGFKVVWFTGADYKNAFKINPKNVVVRLGKSMPDDYLDAIKNRFFCKTASFPIKDFSKFKPVPLGNHIYIYGRNKQDFANNYLKIETAKEISAITGIPLLIGYLGNSIDYTIKHLYSRSFINLKLNDLAGVTSALEMAYMGRYTIGNSNFPFCINYFTKDDIVKRILEQSKRIGFMPKNLANSFFTVGDEWKFVKFWLK
jgi:hypothetical protein